MGTNHTLHKVSLCRSGVPLALGNPAGIFLDGLLFLSTLFIRLLIALLLLCKPHQALHEQGNMHITWYAC